MSWLLLKMIVFFWVWKSDLSSLYDRSVVQIKQLMTILFDNAIKYTEEDGEIEFVVHATDRHPIVTGNG